MTSDIEQIRPSVRVHVTGSDISGQGTTRPSRGALYDTVTLTANDPAQELLPASGRRKIAFVIGVDQAIVIGSSKSGVTAGQGTIIPQSTAWPVDDDEAVYVAGSPAVSGATTARVAVSATYEGGP